MTILILDFSSKILSLLQFYDRLSCRKPWQLFLWDADVSSFTLSRTEVRNKISLLLFMFVLNPITPSICSSLNEMANPILKDWGINFLHTLVPFIHHPRWFTVLWLTVNSSKYKTWQLLCVSQYIIFFQFIILLLLLLLSVFGGFLPSILLLMPSFLLINRLIEDRDTSLCSGNSFAISVQRSTKVNVVHPFGICKPLSSSNVQFWSIF